MLIHMLNSVFSIWNNLFGGGSDLNSTTDMMKIMKLNS